MARTQPLLLTVPNEVIERAIALTVADDLSIASERVSVIRVTRRRSGGVSADVQIMPEGEPKAATK